MESEEFDSGIHEISVLLSSSMEMLKTLLTNPLVRPDSEVGLVVLSIISHFKTRCQVSKFGGILSSLNKLDPSVSIKASHRRAENISSKSFNIKSAFPT